MNNLKNKIWFKIIAVGVMQLFILSQSAFALDLEDKLMYVDPQYEDSNNNNNNQNKTLTIPENSVYQDNSKAVAKTGSTTSYAKLADDLGDCDLQTKCYVLMAAGATIAEIKIVLVGKGHNSEDVNNVLGGNKSNPSNTNVDKVVSDPISVDKVVSDPISVDKVVSNPISVDKVVENPTSVNSAGTYASLAAQGASDVEIVTALKAQGGSATDILKAATDLGQDMTAVAGAMKSAGFSNADIAKAYISKAMDWAADTTVDVVNCAVQSLAEVLTGQGSIVSTVALAYEVIVSDIMQTGKVNIQDGQIMSSMSAIKETASKNGVELQGVNGTMADLENASGSTIVHLDNNHWVTVTNVNGDTVTVMDNYEEITMTKAELQSRWDGNMLTQDSTTGNANTLSAQQMLTIVGAISDGDNDGSHESNGGSGTGGGNNGGNENSGGKSDPTGYEGEGDDPSGYSGANDPSGGYAGEGDDPSGYAGAIGYAGEGDDPSGYAGATGFADKAMDAVADVVGAVVDAAKSFADFTGLTGLANNIAESISTAYGAISAAAKSFADYTGLTTAYGYTKAAVSMVADTVQSLGKKIGEVVDTAFDLVSTPVKAIGNTIDGWGANLSSWGATTGGFIGGAAQVVGGVMSAVGKGISAVGTAVDVCGNIAETAVKTVTGLVSVALGTQTEYGLNADLSMSITGKSVHTGVLGSYDESKQTVCVTMGIGMMTKATQAQIEAYAKALDVNISVISYDPNAPKDVLGASYTAARAAAAQEAVGMIDISFGSALSISLTDKFAAQLSPEAQKALAEAKAVHVSSVAAGNANVPEVGTFARTVCDFLGLETRMDVLSTAPESLQAAIADKMNAFAYGIDDEHYTSSSPAVQAAYNSIMDAGKAFPGGHVGFLDSKEFADFTADHFGIGQENPR